MNIKINRKTFMLIALSSATIFSGCTGKTKNETKNDKKIEKEVEDETKKIIEHEHLIINFGNQQLIFRECEDDIRIGLSGNKYTSSTFYNIYDNNNNVILEGRTSNLNIFYINNRIEEENVREIENELIEKGAKVYQLKKK